MEKLFSRKFIIVVLALIFGSISFWFNKLSAQEYLTFLGIVLGYYGVTKSVEHGFNATEKLPEINEEAV